MSASAPAMRVVTRSPLECHQTKKQRLFGGLAMTTGRQITETENCADNLAISDRELLAIRSATGRTQRKFSPLVRW
jgi:hypothetical protein